MTFILDNKKYLLTIFLSLRTNIFNLINIPNHLKFSGHIILCSDPGLTDMYCRSPGTIISLSPRNLGRSNISQQAHPYDSTCKITFCFNTEYPFFKLGYAERFPPKLKSSYSSILLSWAWRIDKDASHSDISLRLTVPVATFVTISSSSPSRDIFGQITRL